MLWTRLPFLLCGCSRAGCSAGWPRSAGSRPASEPIYKGGVWGGGLLRTRPHRQPGSRDQACAERWSAAQARATRRTVHVVATLWPAPRPGRARARRWSARACARRPSARQ
ncbi:hypothetical protein T492DRAFT_362316 [Pavlovales sp. CCMP2436]|nr:hypothetical protein T492DRAFT_362316 [Pavlovales sp. CCMP2436]